MIKRKPKLKVPVPKAKPTAFVEPILRLPPGSLVRYYSEGWRHGHIVRLKGKVAVIHPIGEQRAVKIPDTDVELVSEWMERR